MNINLLNYYFCFQLNSHQFRTVLPSVARSVEKYPNQPTDSKVFRYTKKHPMFAIYIAAVLIGIAALILAGIFILVSLLLIYLCLLFHFFN